MSDDLEEYIEINAQLWLLINIKLFHIKDSHIYTCNIRIGVFG